MTPPCCARLQQLLRARRESPAKPRRQAPRTWPFALVGLAAAIGCAGSGAGRNDDVALRAPEIAFVLDEAAFGQPARTSMVAFDVVSADMDGDGDPDVLINWHNLAPLELFQNTGGAFALLNPDADDRSGLFENPGVPRLYAEEEQMLAKARRSGVAGVYIWHDPSPRGGWHIYVMPANDPVELRLRANRALTPRLDRRFIRSAGEFDADLEIDTELHFRVVLDRVATELAASASLPIFAGIDLSPVGFDAQLWKDDPHGIAWVHARGTLPPEIFVTRGGLAGALRPPHDPKIDRFFEFVADDPAHNAAGDVGDKPLSDGSGAVAGANLLYADVRGLIPAGYGRGRRVEWVDVDGDGIIELYIGNTASPNTLLARSEAGAYVDVAAALGLDILEGDTFAWLDVDGNDLDDLVFVDDAGFSIAYNRGGRRFEIGAGSDIGLRFPAASEPMHEGLFATLSLDVLDFDNDGRLDLWLTGHGDGRGHALYRGAGGRFVDVTADVGLDTAPLTNSIVLLDLENDGFVDAMILGLTPMWAHNRGGTHFELEEVEPSWGVREFTHGVAVDVDGDALLDLVLAGHRRMVARNATRSAGDALSVLPRAAANDPVGTVVTAHYATGMVRAQRYGSALTTRYSQGLAPLHFGIPAGDAIERIVVRWTDGTVEERALRADESFIELMH